MMQIIRDVFALKLAAASQRGTLYHYTSLKHCYTIIDENRLRAYLWPLKVMDETLESNDERGDFIHTPGPANFGRISPKYDVKPEWNLPRRQEVKVVSFTRDSNFHRKESTHGVFSTVRFAVDGDRLSENYKIAPYAFNPHVRSNVTKTGELGPRFKTFPPEYQNAVTDRLWSWDEQEEILIVPPHRDGVQNFLKYVRSIDLTTTSEALGDYEISKTNVEKAKENIKNRLKFHGLGSLPVNTIN